MGDPSADGHEKVDNFLLEFTNCTFEEIEQAYLKGISKLDIPNIINTCCEEYEDNLFPIDILEKLNMDYTKFWNYDKDDEINLSKIKINTDDWKDIYLKILKIGDPDLEFKIINADATIDIGAYGLFY